MSNTHLSEVKRGQSAVQHPTPPALKSVGLEGALPVVGLVNKVLTLFVVAVVAVARRP